MEDENIEEDKNASGSLKFTRRDTKTSALLRGSSRSSINFELEEIEAGEKDLPGLGGSIEEEGDSQH